MTNYKFGDVVLVWFPQSGKPRPKRRPALVMFDLGDDDAIFAPITSVERTGKGDIVLDAWTQAGLTRASWVRLGKIAAVSKDLVEKSLGRVTGADRARIVTAWESFFRLEVTR
jgi:mRNA interferase MazF